MILRRLYRWASANPFLSLALLWLIIVVSFAANGLLPAYKEATQLRFECSWGSEFYVEPALVGAVIGIAVALCSVPALAIVGAVRSGRLLKGWAITLLATFSIVSAIVPPSLLDWAAYATRVGPSTKGIHLFFGEHGLALAYAPPYILRLVVFLSAIFLLFIIFMPVRKPRVQT